MSSPASARLTVRIDDRERPSGLVDAVVALGRDVVVQRLEVGDVAIGDRVLVERKTLADLCASIDDRRLFDQAYALRGACSRPVLVVEATGTAELGRFTPEVARGVLTSLIVGYGIPVLRTASVEETAAWIDLFATREERRLARRLSAAEGADRGATTRAILAAIPGVGPFRARRLEEELGGPSVVFSASDDTLRRVAGVGRITAARIRAAAGGSATGAPRVG